MVEWPQNVLLSLAPPSLPFPPPPQMRVTPLIRTVTSGYQSPIEMLCCIKLTKTVVYWTTAINQMHNGVLITNQWRRCIGWAAIYMSLHHATSSCPSAPHSYILIASTHTYMLARPHQPDCLRCKGTTDSTLWWRATLLVTTPAFSRACVCVCQQSGRLNNK